MSFANWEAITQHLAIKFKDRFNCGNFMLVESAPSLVLAFPPTEGFWKKNIAWHSLFYFYDKQK